MSVASAALPLEKSRASRTILWGGLVAGVLDITYAFVASGLRGVGPVRVLQSVASGLLGAAAKEGGLATAALGLLLHFLIAFAIATVYYLASRRLGLLVRRAVICGLLYGIGVYLVMNFVVLPLSAIYFKPTYPLAVLLPGLVGHMLLIGLPIALITRRYSK
jgi:uncharacterized membrane protein YagU involved in acid resistance